MRRLWNLAPVRFLRDVVSLYLTGRFGLVAAGLSYFVLLTVFPLLICVTYLMGLADINITAIITNLQPFLPQEALEVIGSYLRYVTLHQSRGLFIAGLVGCWFSASAAYRTIARAMVSLHGGEAPSPLRSLIASILFPPLLILALYLSMAVLVTGEKTLRFLVLRLPFLDDWVATWNWLRFVLLFAMFFLLILSIFRSAAPKGTPRGPTVISSFFSAVALVVSSFLFSWFIDLSARYSLVYGSLVSVVVLLVWLYFCGNVLFLAMIFADVLQQWKKHGY